MAEKIDCGCMGWVNQNTIMKAMIQELHKHGAKHCPYCGARFKIEHVLTVQDSKVGMRSDFRRPTP